VGKLLLGSEDDLRFYRQGRLSPAAAARVANRYQWLAIGLAAGNMVTLLVVFVLTIVLLNSGRGTLALVLTLLALAVIQLGLAVIIWLIGDRAKSLPVQRVRAPLEVGARTGRLRLGEREYRLLGRLNIAPEVGQTLSAYWVQPPFQRTPLALALLSEDEAS
jgi:hypothetical protein